MSIKGFQLTTDSWAFPKLVAFWRRAAQPPRYRSALLAQLSRMSVGRRSGNRGDSGFNERCRLEVSR